MITNYLTFWSLIISYIIFIIIIFFNGVIPMWLFLSVACLLTSTSFIGTFFLTGPLIDKTEETNERLMLLAKDILVHIGPLLIFLLLFKHLFTRLNIPKDIVSKIKLHKIFQFRFFIISIIILTLIGLSYIGIIRPVSNDIYSDIDIASAIILFICVYSSSYQIYFTQIKYIFGINN